MGLGTKVSGDLDHNRTGWANFCRTCGQRYWVPNRDINAPKCTRWTDDTLTERHSCAPFFTPGAVTSAQGNGGR